MKNLAWLLASASLLATPALSAEKAWVTTSVQSGDTVANTATETPLASRLEVEMVDPNESRVGQTFWVDCRGVMSTLASTPGTLTIKVDFSYGNSTGSLTATALGSTGAFTPPTSLSAAPWRMQGWATFNSTGTNGVGTFFGDFEINNANAWVAYSMRPSGMTTGTTGWATGLNTSQYPYNLIEMRVAWQTASASNSITGACFIERRL